MISIHAPRVGSDLVGQWSAKQIGISIHAPRVGSDGTWKRKAQSIRISIHAPRVGSDDKQNMTVHRWFAFQSTLPVWGATSSGRRNQNLRKYFNPRSPCGERPCFVVDVCYTSYISIHAPRVGSDTLPVIILREFLYFNPRSPCGERHKCNGLLYRFCLFQSTLPVWGATPIRSASVVRGKFQSTLPVWGATVLFQHLCGIVGISIHAPRVGSDR